MIELQLGSFTTDRAQQILYIVLCERDADFPRLCFTEFIRTTMTNYFNKRRPLFRASCEIVLSARNTANI